MLPTLYEDKTFFEKVAYKQIKESNSFSYQRKIQKSESLSTSKRGNNSCSKVCINRDFKTKRAVLCNERKGEVRQRERQQRAFF